MEKFEFVNNKIEKSERIPSEQEVFSKFKEIIGKADYRETRKLEDEQGLYCWEVEVLQEDGGTVEYAYMRKGDYKKRGLPGGSSLVTAIHATFIDKEGMPFSGYSVIELVDGEWVDIKK